MYEKFKEDINLELDWGEKDLIRSSYLNAIDVMIERSDKQEDLYPTEFNEWRSYKGFRNYLRDERKRIQDHD